MTRPTYVHEPRKHRPTARDYHSPTKQSGLDRWSRDRSDGSPGEMEVVGSDGSELSESSSDAESGCDGDDEEMGGHEERTANRFLIFEKFPPEIRNYIYKYIIPHDGVIELWADRHNGEGNLFWYTQFPNKAARFLKYAKEIIPCLKLLRVNKQIGAETAGLFYSNNEFRFSGLNGWSVLTSFMVTIGISNTSFLKKIAVHVPFRGGYPRIDRVNRSIDTKTRFFDALKANFGLRSPIHVLAEIQTYLPHFSGTADDCFKCVLRALKTHGNLKSLKLILPVDFRAARKSVVRSPHIKPDTILHKRRMGRYLHDLRRLHEGIPGLEVSVVVRTDGGEVEKAGRFADGTLPDRKIMEELRECGRGVAIVYVDSLGWDLGVD
ncbi:hypothetical protein Vi05172_g11214 [Venturia inaequalis]|nr:hypothetical protein Vi05172_g11214 [Venturia inaequalis]